MSIATEPEPTTTADEALVAAAHAQQAWENTPVFRVKPIQGWASLRLQEIGRVV